MRENDEERLARSPGSSRELSTFRAGGDDGFGQVGDGGVTKLPSLTLHLSTSLSHTASYSCVS